MENVFYGLSLMIDPTKGFGWTESVLSVLVVITLCYLVITGQEVPSWFIAFATVGGFWMGSQAKQHSMKVKK